MWRSGTEDAPASSGRGTRWQRMQWMRCRQRSDLRLRQLRLRRRNVAARPGKASRASGAHSGSEAWRSNLLCRRQPACSWMSATASRSPRSRARRRKSGGRSS